ncbi:hypothetical protein MRX96_019369 [Rhipicephalus microplus]
MSSAFFLPGTNIYTSYVQSETLNSRSCAIERVRCSAALALSLLLVTGFSLLKGTIERCVRTRESTLASLERASDRLSFPLPVKRAAGKAPAQIEDWERRQRTRYALYVHGTPMTSRPRQMEAMLMQ